MKRPVKIGLIALAIMLLILELIRIFVLYKMEEAIHQGISDAGKRNIHIKYGNAQFGWINNSFNLSDLSFTRLQDADTIMTGTIRSLNINGISLRKALFDKKLEIKRISIREPFIKTFDVALKYDTLVTSKNPGRILQAKISSLKITKSRWDRIDIQNKLIMSTHSENIELNQDLTDETESVRPIWEVDRALIEGLKFEFPTFFYDISTQRVRYNREEKSLITDSVIVQPQYSKELFGKKSGKQVDRIQVQAGSIKILGFSFIDEDSLFLKASNVDLGFTLEAYRDKTQPFLKTSKTPLPLEIFQKMKISFSVDTFRIHDSFIAYEEKLKEDRAPGRIYFDRINLLTHDLTNQPATEETNFVVDARFMGTGKLNVHFNLPPMIGGDYYIKGRLEKFGLNGVNNMIKSAVLMEVKSGNLEWMNFSFNYDDIQSSGELEFEFDNLKMTAFKKNNVEKVSLVKTVVLNTILKTNEIKHATLKSKIEFTRDQRRSVFHFWWKSILSGLKAAFITDGKLDPKKLEEEED